MSSQVWAGGRCTCPGSTGNPRIWFCNLLKNAIGWRQGGQEQESKRKGWEGGWGWEGGSRERGCMYTYSWFMLLYGRNQQHCKAAMHACILVAQSRLTLWDPHGLQPTSRLCPWDSPGKNTGVGSHSLPQGIFPTQGSSCVLLHCKWILYHLSRQGSPKATIRWLKKRKSQCGKWDAQKIRKTVLDWLCCQLFSGLAFP